jgi:DNA mismatch endonuclease (patch repair protein)
MADIFTKDKRSEIMSRIKGVNTKPELIVRSLLHRLGYRFRLHRKDLSGKPDIVLPRHKKVIFVHGCFWHGHKGCKRSSIPSSNTEFWETKITKNVERDKAKTRELRRQGWKVLILWQCQIKDADNVVKKIKKFI